MIILKQHCLTTLDTLILASKKFHTSVFLGKLAIFILATLVSLH